MWIVILKYNAHYAEQRGYKQTYLGLDREDVIVPVGDRPYKFYSREEAEREGNGWLKDCHWLFDSFEVRYVGE